MNDDRRSILNMLAAGQITPTRPSACSALDRAPSPRRCRRRRLSGPTGQGQYLRVWSTPTRRSDGPDQGEHPRAHAAAARRRAALQLIPPKAREEVNAAMRKKGIPFDINQLKPENLEELVEQLSD
jgi:hypothetical protein